MIKKIALFLVVLLVLPVAIQAQMDANPVLKAGAVLERGTSGTFSAFTGLNLKLFSDSASGYTAYTQDGYFYQDGSGEIQSVATFMVSQKRFTDAVGKFDPYIAVGTGNIHEIKDGADSDNFALSLEVGGAISGSVSIALCDYYIPSQSKHFVAISIDLTPIF